MKNKSNITFTLNPYLVQFLIVILGTAMIVISDYNFKSPSDWWVDWGNKVVNSIGCTVLAAGGVSIMLELSTIKNYITQAFRNVLFCKFPIEQYQQKELQELKNSIAKYIINSHHREQNLNETLYKFKRNLLELTCGNYYLYHKSNIVLQPDSKHNIIHKQASIEYCLLNQTSSSCNAKFTWSILAPRDNITKEEILDNFTMKNLTVCGTLYDSKEYQDFLSIEKISPSSYSLYDYTINVTLPKYKKEHYTVSVIVEFDIPINDVSQIHKMTLPCKELTHSIHILQDVSSGEKWTLEGNAFTAFYCDQKEPNANFRLEQTIDTSIQIVFNEWALPGAGYEVLLKKSN